MFNKQSKGINIFSPLRASSLLLYSAQLHSFKNKNQKYKQIII